MPSATAQPVIAQLQQFKEVRRGWIGVRIQPVTEDIADRLVRLPLWLGMEDSQTEIIQQVLAAL